jgi:[acyl-carrier-protein] S-malonyltransferase
MKKIAIVFPGQGAQFLKMSKDFDRYQDYIKRASYLYNEDLDDILTNDLERLSQTKYTQPLLVLASMIAYDSMKALGFDAKIVAGFSLGEFSAYYASGIFTFEEVMNIVRVRAEHMDRVANESKGAMAAVVGLDKHVVLEVCNELSDESYIVSIANYNSKDQVVISGHEVKVNEAITTLKEKGARFVKKLNVSGAFHSRLMLEASKAFKHDISSFVKISNPSKKVYINTTALPLDIDELIEQMAKQIYSPVKFDEMIENMINEGVNHFIEVGPGQVLSGLIKKINKDVNVTNVQFKEDLFRLEQIYET